MAQQITFRIDLTYYKLIWQKYICQLTNITQHSFSSDINGIRFHILLFLKIFYLVNVCTCFQKKVTLPMFFSPKLTDGTFFTAFFKTLCSPICGLIVCRREFTKALHLLMYIWPRMQNRNSPQCTEDV